MGRTTDDKKSSTIILRINDECRNYIEKQASSQGISVSEYMRMQIQDQKDGLLRRTHNVMDDSSADDFKSMCFACHIDTNSFFRQVCNLFEKGSIAVERGIVVSKGNYDLTRLEEACERTNQDAQYIIDRITEKLLKG